MSTPLRKVKPLSDHLATIARRINGSTLDLGYWSAMDAFKRLNSVARLVVLSEIKDKTMHKNLSQLHEKMDL